MTTRRIDVWMVDPNDLRKQPVRDEKVREVTGGSVDDFTQKGRRLLETEGLVVRSCSFQPNGRLHAVVMKSRVPAVPPEPGWKFKRPPG